MRPAVPFQGHGWTKLEDYFSSVSQSPRSTAYTRAAAHNGLARLYQWRGQPQTAVQHALEACAGFENLGLIPELAKARVTAALPEGIYTPKTTGLLMKEPTHVPPFGFAAAGAINRCCRTAHGLHIATAITNRTATSAAWKETQER
jgi:hypothetical protein